MKIKRRWKCPNCGRMYYIQPKTNDELAIVEDCQVVGFAIRHCPRCGWLFKIKPREETDNG